MKLMIPQKTLQQLVGESLEQLETEYAISRGFTNRPDMVLVMEGWNKVLAFQTQFSEALFGRWRILVALEDKLAAAAEADQGSKKHHHHKTPEQLHMAACDEVERGVDPLAKCLGSREVHGRPLLVAMLDAMVRSLCPHTQIVQREAYRPFSDVLKEPAGSQETNKGFWGMRRLTVEEGTVEEYLKIFSRCGIPPSYWVVFCKAFLWTLQTHSPYAEADSDHQDLEKPPTEGAFAGFVSVIVAQRAILAIQEHAQAFDTYLYKVSVQRFWNRRTADVTNMGKAFHHRLSTKHKDLLDYFSSTDPSSMTLRFVQNVDLMVRYADQGVGVNSLGGTSIYRKDLDYLNEEYRNMSMPSWAFPILGSALLDALKPYLLKEEELCRNEDVHHTAAELEEAFAVLYLEQMSMTSHATVWEEKLQQEAKDFIEQVAEEQSWSQERLQRRLLEINMEIHATKTYRHTSEELEMGARLAWRNSSKCIGRIAWNTLQVRDCRHIEDPVDMVRDVQEHLKIATCGTHLQSVMTVYKPKAVNEMWGTRFWTTQLVRYACYEVTQTNANGDVVTELMGDPANLDITKYLIKNGLWTPPAKRTRFDVLPLVIKIPGQAKPFVYQLPPEFVMEVEIEHPTCPEVKEMGLRWAAIPALSNFNMNLGGVDYQCMPFNGWFVSVEIVRNLFERYQLAKEWATAMGMDTSTKRIYEQRVYPEMDIAVNHSFEKQGFTMVDMETVGNSFMVHCKRERDQGRECPAQWSWIGGLTGPTNVTWHHEMRDFYVAPQYEYCANQFLVIEFPEEYASEGMSESDSITEALSETSSEQDLAEQDIRSPRVLIAFGSETGTAEAAAFGLARLLRLCKPIVMPLNKVAGLQIVREQGISHMLAITSTFGTGEFPTNADEFCATPISGSVLEGVKVAVLGLGSTLYPDFCQAGIDLNKLLAAAGANMVLPLKKVDDAIGSDGPIEDWIRQVERMVLPTQLKRILERRAASKHSSPARYELAWSYPERAEQLQAGLERFVWPAGLDEACECLGNEELIIGGDIDSRSTRKLTFRLPEGQTYKAGDHLSVQPLNSMDLVCRFVACFEEELFAAFFESDLVLEDGAEPEQQVNVPLQVDCIEDGDRLPARVAFPTPSALSAILQSQIDLAIEGGQHVTNLMRLVRRVLTNGSDCNQTQMDASHVTQDEGDLLCTFHGFEGRNAEMCQELSSWMGDIIVKPVSVASQDDKSEAVAHFVDAFPNMVLFLEAYGPLLCRPNVSKANKNALLSLADLLPLMPRLRPRYYSISSSPNDDPSQVSITTAVVHVAKSNTVIHGVCSNYLARLTPGKDRVKISVRASHFRGPDSIKAPLILVGAGTGLAPMMGFLRDRARNIASARGREDKGPAHLFFGCRSSDERIYGPVLDGWLKEGVIDQEHLALSREPSTMPKTYVQDLLLEAGEELSELLLQPDTHYYVCGDAEVGDACYEACVEVLHQYGNLSRISAVNYIKRMRVENRWQFDLWGTVTHFSPTSPRKAKRKQSRQKSTQWLRSFAIGEEDVYLEDEEEDNFVLSAISDGAATNEDVRNAAASTLFDRLGGEAAVRAAVDEFYKRLLDDPKLAHMFEGVPLAMLKAHQFRFFKVAFTEIPSDLDVKAVMIEKHERLFREKGLNAEHFDLVAGHLVATLKHLGVADALIDEAAVIVLPLRAAFEEGAAKFAPKKISLLDRIGGMGAVRATVNEFYQRLLEDKELAPMFEGVSMSKLKVHQLRFFKVAFTEIPDDLDVHKMMIEKHEHLFREKGLNAHHFDLVAGHLVATLKHLGVASDLIDEAAAIVLPLRAAFEEGAAKFSPKELTLLDRIGGMGAVRATVDEFYTRLLEDEELAPMFEGVPMSKLKVHQLRFFKTAFTKIPDDLDVHKLMIEKHEHLFMKKGLNAHHFDLVAGHLVATLNHLGVASDLIDEAAAIVLPLRTAFEEGAAKFGAEQSSLLDRIGGMGAVQATVDEFYQRLLEDRQLAPMFEGVPLGMLKAHQVQFFKVAFTQIPDDLDVHKLMVEKHERLFQEKGLNAHHFDLVAGHLVATLKHLGVADNLIDEAAAIVLPLRAAFEEGAAKFAPKVPQLLGIGAINTSILPLRTSADQRSEKPSSVSFALETEKSTTKTKKAVTASGMGHNKRDSNQVLASQMKQLVAGLAQEGTLPDERAVLATLQAIYAEEMSSQR